MWPLQLRLSEYLSRVWLPLYAHGVPHDDDDDKLSSSDPVVGPPTSQLEEAADRGAARGSDGWEALVLAKGTDSGQHSVQ